MRAFFKVRRRSTRMFTKMPPASKPGKALQKPALDAGSSSPQPAVKPQIEPARVCFMCDEGVGDMVQCTSPHCTRAAHRSCAGFDVPRSSRFAPAAEQEASFLCDECIPETEEGSKYNTIVRARGDLLCGGGWLWFWMSVPTVWSMWGACTNHHRHATSAGAARTTRTSCCAMDAIMVFTCTASLRSSWRCLWASGFA